MLLAILACWATFAGGPPALVNTDADGERVPLGPATAWAADAEATRVAFVTPARALPDLDANDVDDVYVKDPATGELVLASRGADGTAAGGTYPLAISGDGRYVVFYSWATNLGPGFPDDGSMNYYRAENPLWEPD